MNTTPIQEKTFPSDEKIKLPRTFILRRLHSLLGLWLVLYLCEHLLVNSQAGLFFDDDGEGFVSKVNRIHQLPYLPAIEIIFLAFPFAIHGIWGIFYLRSAKYNSSKGGGKLPELPQYKRNHAYTWQRMTSWLLVIGILAHVIQMRFIEYPALVHRGLERIYFTRLNVDNGLYGIAHKLRATIFDQKELNEKFTQLDVQRRKLEELQSKGKDYFSLKEEIEEEEKWLKAALKKPLKEGNVLVASPTAGVAFLLALRDMFKSPAMVILYSILVIASTFHAFNGLWTFLITWGVTLTRRAQRNMRHITTVLMIVVILLGLVAAWGTYFSTLGQ